VKAQADRTWTHDTVAGMVRVRLFTSLVLLFAIGSASAEEPPRAPPPSFADVGDLKLENGQVLRACRVGYHTAGQLNAARSNAVLFPTWYSGSSQDQADLVGPGKLIDSTRYFVITVDALANGVSSSPSNSPAQPRMRFPEVSIRDMVQSQYLLLTRVLKIDHLRAVMGISMGGMQAFQWAFSYPTFMDKVIPIAGSPQLAAYDLLLWQANLDAIHADPDWMKGEYRRQPVLRAVQDLQNLALTTPQHYNRETTRQQFQDWWARRPPPSYDANDRVRQLQAMMRHDVTAGFDGSIPRAAAAVKAAMLVVVDAHDMMVTPGPALQFATAAKARVLNLDSDCGHIVPTCERDKIGAAIAAFLDK
jgi:homoserine O-acetyltransferase